ncbi:tetratricopeptide repeat protein [Lentzea sp. NEAU-D13]|uniref:Tetratricopeptide repeat protein n=1 Tax=Lentzea alba TaxID=2714351 RepID=A0A7C9S0G1_9PSEU|nr:tetratricopeptide repeat protein [Lentzea alba]NGY65743.1 tetratricopeptide repeat protein [Lentzea alba]
MSHGVNTVNGVHGTVIGNVVQAGSITIAEAPPPAIALGGLPPQSTFVGRDEQVAVLSDLLRPDASVPVVLVDGLAGIGKTALALRVAASRKREFSGGVVMIDMRGYDDEEQRVTAFAALGSLLRAVGVHAERVPVDLPGRSWLWRTVLAEYGEHPILVVIDNVSAVDQVVPLLPGDGAHKVLVTSRHRLAGLPGGRMTVPALPSAAAIGLLTDAGDHAERLSSLCGGLPLALRTVAALLATDPGRPVTDLIEALEDESERLTELDLDGTLSVRAAFNLSYERLDEAERRALRLLAVNKGPHVSAEAAARLLDSPVRAADRMLRRLQRASLIERGTFGRWLMHDLLRLYATELGDTECAVASVRLVEHYLDGARGVATCLDPQAEFPVVFSTRAEALRWADIEFPNLIAVFSFAADHHVRDLCTAMKPYFELRRPASDWIFAARCAVRACVRLNDDAGSAIAHNALGNAFLSARRVADALWEYETGLSHARNAGDSALVSMALVNIGNARRVLGDPMGAMELYEYVRAVQRTSGHRLGSLRTLINLGAVYRELGKQKLALRALTEALEQQQIEGFPLEVIAAVQLGHAYRDAGLRRLARQNYERALETCRDLGDDRGTAAIERMVQKLSDYPSDEDDDWFAYVDHFL